MNASSYKTVFSKRLGALVAVGEHATSQGKANGASGPGASGASEGAASALAGIGYVAALSASFAFVSIAWAAPATTALPTGGTVVQGAASMAQSANQLNITQSTQRAAINWQSFNIGAAATVKVAQPNAQAVLLNRVVGQSPSQIFGKLQANGHVILVNPNGVLFGKDGSVNAGGFTASTLNISDANFMAGNMVYERNGSTAGIVNQGSITAAPGGYVALLGATVSNEGSITTKGGSVVMGAGETIKVPVSGTGRIKLELTPAAITASVSNSGSIVTEGGQVYMQALALNRAAAQILQSGSIDTTGEKGGDVHVLADGGHIRVDGSITANSRNGTAGGDIYIGRDNDTNVLAAVGDVSGARLESQGGFVETSGKYLVTTGTRVKAKDWLLDPYNITIKNNTTTNTVQTTENNTTTYTPSTNGSVVYTGDIQDNINAGTSVTITTAGAANNPGTEAGNITIENSLTFNNQGNQAATFKLIADNGITQKATAHINAEGKNLVNIEMIANGQYQGNSSPSSNSQGILLGGNITTNGSITLNGSSSGSDGVRVEGSNLTAGENILITGVTSADGRSGIHFSVSDINQNGQKGDSTWRAKNISLTGIANTISGTKGTGVRMHHGARTGTLIATQDVKVEGTVNGGGSGSGVLVTSNGWGLHNISLIGQDIKVRGNVRTTDNDTSNAVQLNGLQAQAKNNMTLQGETLNASATTINVTGIQYHFSNGYVGNATSMQADNNLLIQANQGSIAFNEGTRGAAEPTSPNPQTSTSKLTGKNITIDNTGAGMTVNGTANANANGDSIDANGTITAGTGKATNVGVLIADGRAITATGNLNIAGASTGAVGINTNGVLTATNNVNLTGTSSGINANAHGVMLTGKVNSTAGAVNITGSSEASNGGAGAIIQATVDAKNNITLDGRTANTNNVQGLVIQDAVNSVDGNITVTGETKAGDPGQRAVAITANGTKNGSLKVKDGQTININANTLFINTASSVDAGLTGTVNIKTLTADNAIVIGGPGANDAMNADLSKQTLGIDQTELNRITAGNLVIGGTTSTKNIIVSGAVNTAEATGNITLKTAGDIAINEKLEVNANKTLTLIAGTSVTDNANGAIKASQLELLGNAAVTLDSKLHEVGKLAADVKSLEFKNKTALAVDTVTTVNSASGGTVGIKAKDGVSVTTEEGDLSLNQSISNSTTGNVVVGAGVSQGAGVSSGGDVIGSATLSNIATSGKVFVYSGSAANTGVLSGMNSGFTELKVTGDATQNAETNTAFGSGNGISINGTPSTANAQVIFREKLNLTGVLVGTAVNKTYGDSTTENTATSALLAEAKNALKGAPNSSVTVGASNNNPILVSKSAVVDSLTAPTALTDGAFSSAGFLKAQGGIYQFKGFTSTKYNVGSLDVGVNVAQRNITIAATPTTVTFSGGTQTQAARTQTGEFLTGDKVEVTGGSASGTAVGTYNDGIAVAAALADDLANYNVTVRNSSLTIAAAPVVPVIVPFIRPDAGNNAGSRVRTVSGFGGAGAATGVLDDKSVTESREVCSDVFPENCECQPSVIPSIEICFAPKSVAATKEEK